MSETTPLTMLNDALARGNTDTAIILRLTDLYQQWVRDEKAKAYTAAMLAVQGELPRIFKDAENSSTRSRYGTLEGVLAVVSPILQRHGFTPSFGTEPCDRPDCINVSLYLTHAGGHTERTSASYPMDSVGLKGQPNKTPIQGTVSAHSYAQRNLLKLALNLNFTGEDNDGVQAPDPPISQQQAAEIIGLVDRLNGKAQSGFLDWISKFGAKRIGDIPVSRYAMTVDLLRRKLEGAS